MHSTEPRRSTWTKLRQKQKAGWRIAFHSVWHNTAKCLTGLISILTTVLIIYLMVSLFGVNGSRSSFANIPPLIKGSCDASSRYNTWLHLAINAVSSGVLASSNLFKS